MLAGHSPRWEWNPKAAGNARQNASQQRRPDQGDDHAGPALLVDVHGGHGEDRHGCTGQQEPSVDHEVAHALPEIAAL